MRILGITNLYPNPYQPLRATFNRHRFRIHSNNNPVRVISPISWIDEYNASISDGPLLPTNRQLVNDGILIDHPRYYYPPKFGRSTYGWCYFSSIRRSFEKVVAEFQPDIILAPWVYPDGWAAVKFGKTHSLPVVILMHGSDILFASKFPSKLKQTQWAIRNADGVIAVSRDLAERVIEWGADPERVLVNYDGVDVTRFFAGSKPEAQKAVGLNSQKKNILFVGNLVPVKGLSSLIEACQILKQTYHSFQCFIIGRGTLRKELESQIRNLNLENHVCLFGPVAHEKLPDWYRAADLFVLPSLSEGVPNVLLEAFACGTKFVASAVGGIPEIASFGRGKLVPPERPAELASAMGQMLDDETAAPEFRRSREEAVLEAANFLEYVRSNYRSSDSAM